MQQWYQLPPFNPGVMAAAHHTSRVETYHHKWYQFGNVCMSLAFFCSNSRRWRCRRKLVEVVPCEDTINLLARASKKVALLPISWRRCFTFCQKFILLFFSKKSFHAVKSLGLINLTSLSVLITHFTIGAILIIMIYCINHSFVLQLSEFRLGISLLYYVNVRNLGDGNICSETIGMGINGSRWIIFSSALLLGLITKQSILPPPLPSASLTSNTTSMMITTTCGIILFVYNWVEEFTVSFKIPKGVVS